MAGVLKGWMSRVVEKALAARKERENGLIMFQSHTGSSSVNGAG